MEQQEKKIVLVTGASEGIGRAVAVKMAEEGNLIVINYRRNKEAAQETLKMVREAGGDGVIAQADVADPQQVESLFARVKKKFGTVDVLINNAGIIKDKYLLMMTEEDFMDVINTNLGGCFHCTKAAVRLMVSNEKGGSIVNIASTSGLSGQIGQANYSSSKGGIVSFSKTVAKEYAGKNIRVNAVAPGFVETKMTKGNRKLLEDQYMQFIPLNRFGKPSEIAEAVAFLASEKASYITGQCLVADGGLIM